MQWRRRLLDARRMGQMIGSEYDKSRSQDLGSEGGSAFGVACGLGQPQAASTVWTRPGPRQTTSEFLNQGHAGTLVRVADPSARSPFGRVVGVAQTFMWMLVRPHECPQFMRHRPGWTPSKHLEQRWRQWAMRVIVGAFATALASAAVAGLVTLLKAIF
jgi:hypothetical protein